MKRLYRHRTGDEQSQESDDACHLAMLKCCMRYQSLSGPGFQIAINHDEFAKLGECVEVFASPFNCVGVVYGSAFVDTDACFGSLGSAFTWFSQAHSQASLKLEANPPFIPQVLEAFVDLLASLSEKNGRLSVVVPVWKDAPYYDKLVQLGSKQSLTEEWVQPNQSGATTRKIPTPCELFTI